MKKIVFSLMFIILSACGKAHSGYNAAITPNLAHKAYHYYGLNEEEDHLLIQDLLGIDPRSTEWCAAFVNVVLLQNNYPTSRSVSDYPLMARSFTTYGEKVEDEPKQGDIMVFKRGSEGWQGHVGFYIGTQTVDGKLFYKILGGNQDNAVTLSAYPASKLLAIRRVANIHHS